MSQLLILGTSILAIGPLVDTGDSIQCPDIIYPKSVIPGYQIQDVALPSDFTIESYEWVFGALKKILVPEPQISNDQAHANYIGMMLSRADVLVAHGFIVEALLLRESLK